MEFVELSFAGLRAESVRLADAVVASGFHPDLVAYLAKGGWPIGEAVSMHLATPLIELSSHRSGDAAKERNAAFLRALPRSVRHLLREAEMRVRLLRGPSPAQAKSMCVTERYPLPSEAARVLIVDDAADTGASLAAAVGELRRLYPRADIRTAVLNESTSSSFKPDWSLHRDCLLCTPASKDSSEYLAFLEGYCKDGWEW